MVVAGAPLPQTVYPLSGQIAVPGQFGRSPSPADSGKPNRNWIRTLDDRPACEAILRARMEGLAPPYPLALMIRRGAPGLLILTVRFYLVSEKLLAKPVGVRHPRRGGLPTPRAFQRRAKQLFDGMIGRGYRLGR